MSTDPAQDVAATLNSMHAGTGNWATAMGITFVRASPDEVVADVEIGPQHRQPYGIVHGGVQTPRGTERQLSTGCR